MPDTVPIEVMEASPAIRQAIISALPIDWDDRTTLVKVIADADETGHPWMIWGHPEQVADAILAALQPHLIAVYAAGHEDGHEDGVEAVSEMSLMSLLDIELDKLDEPVAKEQLRVKLSHLLPDNPFDARIAVDQIVTAVGEVFDE